MSKYYKADEVEKLLNCGCAYAIRDLPTIEVSEDCITRKWLKENAKVLGDYYENTVWAVPLSILEEAPSVVPTGRKNRQVERAEGEWIYTGQYPYDKCSLCGTLVDSYDGWNYCPNCGAKMKGASDE